MLSKEAYYFSHDANARHDPKILGLRGEHGMFGYGVYWLIVEMMREQDEYKLPLKKYIFNAIAMQVQCTDFTKEDAKQFVYDCIDEFDLFVSDDEYFWSNSLVKRMEKKNSVSEKRKKAAQKRWQKERQNKDQEDDESKSNANAMQNDANAKQVDARKGNEKKGNEKKESKPKQQQEQDDVAAVVQFWDENGFGYNNINAKQQLLEWLDEPDLIDPGQMLIESMKIASAANKRNLKYIEGIMRNWINNDCKTIDDVKAHQEDFENRGKAMAGNKNGVDFDALRGDDDE